LRQLKGKPQAAHTFRGNSYFLRIFGICPLSCPDRKSWAAGTIRQPRLGAIESLDLPRGLP
jgi:hypothetical protein